MYNFRNVSESDFNFLYGLNESTTKDYVERVWGWDEGFQKNNFRSKFRPSMYKIIVKDNKDIGALALIERGSKLFIKRIQILPEYQHKGLGTMVLKDILKDAEETGKVVTTKVLKSNPAHKFYQTLGFSFIGETETHYIMNNRF